MKILKVVFRLILGIVFTLSGFFKAVDPLGFGYKLTDYFTDAFGMPSLSGISLILSVLLIAFEFLVGICLIINIKPRLSALVALLFMLVFTPLTLYIAIANPVTDCGCFGDALVIGNWETFIKNIVLLPMSIFLFIGTKGENNTYKPKVDWLIAGLVFLLIILFQFYNLRHLPIIDFRAYKVGANIPELMVVPPGEKTDSFAIFYTMQQIETGETKKVDDKTYINDEVWKDTLWKITETSDPVLVKSGYKPPIYNFSAYPVNLGNLKSEAKDVMDSILAEKNYSFIIVSYDMSKAKIEDFNRMDILINYAYSKNISTNLLTSTTSGFSDFIQKLMYPIQIFNTDPITLKTVIRSNPGLLLIKQGKIIGKWHYNDIPTIPEFDEIIAMN